jgi:hypothetical protein
MAAGEAVKIGWGGCCIVAFLNHPSCTDVEKGGCACLKAAACRCVSSPSKPLRRPTPLSARLKFTDFPGLSNSENRILRPLGGVGDAPLRRGCRLENEMNVEDQSRIKTNHLTCWMTAQKMTRSPRNISFFHQGGLDSRLNRVPGRIGEMKRVRGQPWSCPWFLFRMRPGRVATSGPLGVGEEAQK